MIKELKYLLFLFVIFLIFFLLLKNYFSDDNKNNSYRYYRQVDEKIARYSENVILLRSDTSDIAEYVEKTIDKNKKNFSYKGSFGGLF